MKIENTKTIDYKFIVNSNIPKEIEKGYTYKAYPNYNLLGVNKHI